VSLASPRRKPQRADAAAATIVVSVAVVACLLLALAIGVSAGNCSLWFAIPGLCDSPTVALPAAAIVAALPVLAFTLSGRPLAALLGLYIVLVPIDDALLVGGGFTVTKIIGLGIAIAAYGEACGSPSHTRSWAGWPSLRLWPLASRGVSTRRCPPVTW
jgi:hypothetical protein